MIIETDEVKELFDRMERAANRYGNFTSTHEALGVAYEEWIEFAHAVHSNDFKAIRHEALDLAAVLLRFAGMYSDHTMKARSGK